MIHGGGVVWARRGPVCVYEMAGIGLGFTDLGGAGMSQERAGVC